MMAAPTPASGSPEIPEFLDDPVTEESRVVHPVPACCASLG